MGKVQGIKLTPTLRSIVDQVLALPQPPSSSVTSSIQESTTKKKTDKNDSNSSSSTSSSSASSSTTPQSAKSASLSSPSALIEQAQQAKRRISQSSLSVEEAKSILETVIHSKASVENDKSSNNNNNNNNNNDTTFLPLAGVPALKFLITNSTSSTSTSPLLQTLETTLLTQTSLSFSPPPLKTTTPAYRKRLQRLRLHDEERSYKSLTTNLKTAASLKDDNVTAKSMMYATSVGLNMVVAPITFGTFMYFFAGSIFSRFFDDPEEQEDARGNAVDVRRVIAGVVSGVFMLFVEMILFVIRSDTLDSAVRKKGRRRENRANAFGYTEKSMARTYIRDD